MLLSAIRTARRSAARSRSDTGLVRVRGGYSPDVVRAPAGRPIRIAFVREETASCSERVVFPAFGRSTMLPYGERVLVELPAAPPGIYEFTCAMNMLRGTLLVE